MSLPPQLSEGELWSFIRSVMSQGADIRCDYDQGVHRGYEAYSAHMDVAASKRAQELFARVNAHGEACAAAERERWIAVVEEAFREGFHSPITYNDTVQNSVDASWDRAKASLLRDAARKEKP